MRWIPRLRMLLARRPWIYWLVIAALAAAVAGIAASTLADLDHRRASWGNTVTVLTASRALGPGDLLSGAVTAVDLPESMVPSSAVHAVDDVMVATQRLAAGEVVVELDVSSAAGPRALLPSGWMAISVHDQADDTMFQVGDPAAVLADGAVLAPDAVVVALDDGDVIVGVPSEAAPAVASAVVQGSAVVALSASTGS